MTMKLTIYKSLLILCFILLASCARLSITKTDYNPSGEVTAITRADYYYILQNKAHKVDLSKDNTDGSFVFEYTNDTNNDPAVQLFKAGFEAGKMAATP